MQSCTHVSKFRILDKYAPYVSVCCELRHKVVFVFYKEQLNRQIHKSMFSKLTTVTKHVIWQHCHFYAQVKKNLNSNM